MYDQTQQGRRETPVFPRASQNVAVAAMILQTTPEPSTDEAKRVHQELRDLLGTAVMQQAQSSMERWHPKASFVHISCGSLEGHHTPSML